MSTAILLPTRSRRSSFPPGTGNSTISIRQSRREVHHVPDVDDVTREELKVLETKNDLSAAQARAQVQQSSSLSCSDRTVAGQADTAAVVEHAGKAKSTEQSSVDTGAAGDSTTTTPTSTPIPPSSKEQASTLTQSEVEANAEVKSETATCPPVQCTTIVNYNPDPLSSLFPSITTTTTTTSSSSSFNDTTNTFAVSNVNMKDTETTASYTQYPGLNHTPNNNNTLPYKGLINIGSTCYLNSALQMLMSIDGFVNLITSSYQQRQEVEQQEKEGDGKDDPFYPLRDELAKLFLSLQPNHSMNENPRSDNSTTLTSATSTTTTTTTTDMTTMIAATLPIVSFKEQIDKSTKQFIGYRQQDSHEFLSSLLDLLHDELVKRKPIKRNVEQDHNLTETTSCSCIEQQQNNNNNNDDDGINKNVNDKSRMDVEETKSELSELFEEGGIEGDKNDVEEQNMDMDVSNHEVTIKDDDHQDSQTPTITKDGYVLVNKKDTIQNNDNHHTDTGTDTGIGTDNDDQLRENQTRNTSNKKARLCTHVVKKDEHHQHLDLKVEPSSSTITNESMGNNSRSGMRISKVPSFSTLKLEEIGVLLHGATKEHEQENQYITESPLSTSSSQLSSSCVSSLCNNAKLVGGRVTPSTMQKTNHNFITEYNNDDIITNNNNGSQNMSIDEGMDIDLPNNNSSEASVLSFQNCNNNNTQEKEEDEQKSITTAVDTYFTMEVRICLKCDSCNYTRSHAETFRHLSIEVAEEDNDENNSFSQSNMNLTSHHERTIQEGIRKFFASEKRDLKCEKCFGESATQSMEITRLPKALLIHLKRFIVDISPDYSSITYRKNKAAVEFSKSLTLQPDDDGHIGVLGEFLATDITYPSVTMDDENDCHNNDIKFTSGLSLNESEEEGYEMIGNSSDNDEEERDNDDNDGEDFIDLGMMKREYKIRSVVNHIGSTAGSGHYTAIARRPYDNGKTREWTKFNDSLVSKLSDDEAFGKETQRRAYLILYEFE